MVRLSVCAVVVLGLPASPTQASVYHVAQGHVAQGHVAQGHSQADDSNPGTAAQPWRTVSHAARLLTAGDTVMIHEGVYREFVSPARSGTASRPIRYVAVEGDVVVITGADVITGWIAVGHGVWKKAPWRYRFRTHPNDERHRLVGRCEQVIVDGKLLKQVSLESELEPGCFCADTDGRQLLLHLQDGSDPNQHLVEASVRSKCFGTSSKERVRHHIHVQGLTMRYAANTAQNGTLFACGDHWLIEDCDIQWTNGTGVSFRGDDITLRRVATHHHGQQGARGYGRRFLMEDVVLNHNNLEGYDTSWEGGAIKISRARDGVVRRCRAEFNRGNAFWFDIDVRDIVVEQCVAKDNDGHGIFVEISGGFQIRNNLCVRNGRDNKWGRGGISVGESDHCTIEQNTCVLNPTGISVREIGPRTFPDIAGERVSYHVHDIVIRKNVCALNTKYQLGLWWDNAFFGPHPSKKDGKQPGPLDPDAAALQIDHNVYGLRDDQQLALWGVPWRPQHREYDDLSTWQQQRRFDQHSRVADPHFANPSEDDWRVPAEAPAGARDF